MANQHTSPWSAERKAEFAALWPTHTAKQLAARYGCSVRAIEKQARYAGIRKHPEDFSADEQALIRLHYPVGGAMLAHQYMPTRNRKSINQFASRFKIAYEPWPEPFRLQLAEWCRQGFTFAEMGRLADRRPGNVRHAVLALGLSITPKAKAEKAPKVIRLKAEKPVRLPLYKQAEVQQQVAAYVAKGRTTRYIAKEMELGNSTVQRILNELGLSTATAKAPTRGRADFRVRRPASPAATRPAPMKIVPDERPAVRFQPKPACGKKSPSKVVEGGEKTVDYLKGLPRLHPHQQAYERLTRPGQPRRDMRFKSQFLSALEETQPLQLAA